MKHQILQNIWWNCNYVYEIEVLSSDLVLILVIKNKKDKVFAEYYKNVPKSLLLMSIEYLLVSVKTLVISVSCYFLGCAAGLLIWKLRGILIRANKNPVATPSGAPRTLREPWFTGHYSQNFIMKMQATVQRYSRCGGFAIFDFNFQVVLGNF